jgi:hypothetical protein
MGKCRIQWLTKRVIVDGVPASTIPAKLIEPYIIDEVLLLKPLIPEILAMLCFFKGRTDRFALMSIDLSLESSDPEIDCYLGNVGLQLQIMPGSGGKTDFSIQSVMDNKYVAQIIFDDIPSITKKDDDELRKKIIAYVKSCRQKSKQKRGRLK